VLKSNRQGSQADRCLTGDGARRLLGRVGGEEAGERVGRVGAEEHEGDVGRREELGRLAAAAVREQATGVDRRRAVADGHRVEAGRVLHLRLQVEVLERQQHFLRRQQNNITGRQN